MEKNKVISPFAAIMISIMVVITVIDAVMNADGAMSAIKITAMFAAICGVVNCSLSSDGSIWNWLFGLPAVACQGIVALHDGNVGVGWMDLAFLVPMQIIGLVVWMKRGASLSSDGDDAQVNGRRLKWWQAMFICLAIAAALTCLSPLLRSMNSNAPWLDAAAVVMQIVAQILMTLAYMEQWLIWIVVNTVYLVLWIVTYINGGDNAVLMIAMWACYLVISIHGFRIWCKISK